MRTRLSKKRHRVLLLSWLVRFCRDERAFRLLQEMGYTIGGSRICTSWSLAQYRSMAMSQALGSERLESER